MKKRYGLAAATISAALAFSITACGGDSSSSSEGTIRVNSVNDLSANCEDGEEALVGEEEEVLYTCADGKWVSEEAKSSASKPSSSVSKEDECNEDLENCDEKEGENYVSSSSKANSSASKGDSSSSNNGSEEGSSSDSGSSEEGGSSSSGSEEGSSSDSGSGEEGSSSSSGSEEGSSSDSGSSEEGSSSSSGSSDEPEPETNIFAFSDYDKTLPFGATTLLENKGLQEGGYCTYSVTGNLSNVTIIDAETHEVIPDFSTHVFANCKFSVQNTNVYGTSQSIEFTITQCEAYACESLTPEIGNTNKASITLASGTKPTLSTTSSSLEYNETSTISLAGYENCVYKVTDVPQQVDGLSRPDHLIGASDAYSVTGAAKNSDGNYESDNCSITIKNISTLTKDFSVKVTLVQAMHSTNAVTITPSGVSTIVTVKHKAEHPAEFNFLNNYVTWTSEKEATVNRENSQLYITGTFDSVVKAIEDNGYILQNRTDGSAFYYTKKVDNKTYSIYIQAEVFIRGSSLEVVEAKLTCN